MWRLMKQKWDAAAEDERVLSIMSISLKHQQHRLHPYSISSARDKSLYRQSHCQSIDNKSIKLCIVSPDDRHKHDLLFSKSIVSGQIKINRT